MRFTFKKLRAIGSALIACTLAVSFAFTPASPVFAPEPVEAQWAVIDPSNLIQNTWSAISEGASAISAVYLEFKESVGDGLAWALINMVIEEMIKSVTQWVASGFQGKPAFLEDLNKFLGDLADNVVGDFIWNSDALGFLCSPFSFNVKLALDLQYSAERDYRKSQCTLSGAIDNLDNFMSENWDNWFEVTMNPSNNPYGALSQAQAGLTANLRTARGSATKELEFGSGFFSQKECVTDSLAPGEVGPPNQTCKTVTPGETIQNQISSALNIPRERLAFADELNELIGALLTQLARGVLSEVGGGLSGLGGSGSNGGGIFNDPDQFPPTSGGGFGGQTDRIFSTDREREERYLTLSETIIDTITDALATPGARCDAVMRSDLSERITAAQAGRTDAATNITTINDFEDDINALTDPSVIQQRLQTYLSTIQPTLHTARQVAELEAATANLPSNDDEVIEAAAQAGNIVALAQLYERSCSGR